MSPNKLFFFFVSPNVKVSNNRRKNLFFLFLIRNPFKTKHEERKKHTEADTKIEIKMTQENELKWMNKKKLSEPKTDKEKGRKENGYGKNRLLVIMSPIHRIFIHKWFSRWVCVCLFLSFSAFFSSSSRKLHRTILSKTSSLLVDIFEKWNRCGQNKNAHRIVNNYFHERNRLGVHVDDSRLSLLFHCRRAIRKRWKHTIEPF